jgi:hypothetical protein
MSSRIGRRYAQHSYPESRATQSLPLARNSAFGPPTNTSITSTANPPTQAVEWFIVENGVTSATDNATIVPSVSGVLLIQSVVNANNPSGGSITLSAVVTINGAATEQISSQVIPAGDNGSVSLLAIVPDNVIGTPVNVGVKVSGNGLTLTALFTYLSVQEVVPATP